MATKFEYNDGPGNQNATTYAGNWNMQSFTPQIEHNITLVKLYLYKTAGGTGTWTVEIKATDGAGKPTGPVLATGTLDIATLTTSYTQRSFNLAPTPVLSAGVKYCIVGRASDAPSNTPWHRDSTGVYPRGSVFWSATAGASWNALADHDLLFEEWGDATIPDPPTVTTQAASSIDVTSAVGNGNITDVGGELCDKRGIVYSESSHGDPGDTAPADSDYEDYEEETDSFGTGAFTRTLTGLTAGVTYYARAYAHNGGGYSYGGEISFTTLTVPVVTTQSVSSILSHNATGNGNITNIGASTPTKRGICWNTAGNPTVADKKKEETGSFGTGAFTGAMTKLTVGTKYYVRAYAYNSYGYGYGSQVQMIAGGVPSESGDGTCYNTWGDWTICRLGNVPVLVAAGSPIEAVAMQLASYWIYRGFLYFDLSHVPADFRLARAILQPYGKSKGSAPITIVVVEGHQGDPLIATNYQGQASTQTVFGSIASDDVILEAYNSITLNQDGIDLIKSKFGSTLKLCLKDQDDNDDDPMPYSVNRLFTFYPGEDEGKEPILLLYPLASRAQGGVVG